MKKFLYNPYVIVAILGLIIILLFKFWTRITQFLNRIKAKAETQDHDKKSNYGQVEINLQEVADSIYIAFHEQFLFDEDELSAMNEIRRVGPVNVKKVAELYAKKGYNLFTDFKKYVSEEQYQSIKYLMQ